MRTAVMASALLIVACICAATGPAATAQTAVHPVGAVMAAAAPGPDPQALVMIFVYDLPRPVSAIDWWLSAGTGLQSNFADYHVVKEGIDKLGDHEVYYSHFTWQVDTDSVMYGVTIMFSEGTTGLLFMAVTPNDPDHVQQYVPVFLQIAETLHPGP